MRIPSYKRLSFELYRGFATTPKQDNIGKIYQEKTDEEKIAFLEQDLSALSCSTSPASRSGDKQERGVV